MGAALLVCRVALAIVFVVAGLAKLADVAGSRGAVVEFGVPERLGGALGRLLPAAELAVGLALIPSASARYGAVGAAVLLGGFMVAIANALAHGRAPDCHCFGQVHSAPAGGRTLGRNAALLGLAGFVAIAGWQHPGVSATHWVTEVGGGWLVASGAGVVIVAVVSFQAWFSLQLLSQNGRVLARLESLEAMLRRITPTLAAEEDGVMDPGPLGYGLAGGGLPVGSPAPGFELEDADGARQALESLIDNRRLMLIFSSAGCGPCDALMPEVAVWERQYRDSLRIGLVASGDRDQNRAKAREHGVELVLLQAEREVADAYQAYGTPMAVVIDPDRRIASPTVGGAEAIATLVAQVTRPALNLRHVPSANAQGNGSAPRPDTSRVGQAAPDLVLEDLDRQRVSLKDLYDEPTLVLFWNPGCGFCEQMLPGLKAFEDDPPPGAPRIVVISAGDPERVREQQIGSLVLIDADAEAMRAFAAGGTPMGVLVEHGRIASPVAAGESAVFELISGASHAEHTEGTVLA